MMKKDEKFMGKFTYGIRIRFKCSMFKCSKISNDVYILNIDHFHGSNMHHVSCIIMQVNAIKEITFSFYVLCS